MSDLETKSIRNRTPIQQWPHPEIKHLTVKVVYDFIDQVFKFTQSFQQPVNIVTAISPVVSKTIISQAARIYLTRTTINNPDSFHVLLQTMVDSVKPSSAQELIKAYQECVIFPEILVKGGLKGISTLAWGCLTFIDQTRLFFDAFHSADVMKLPTNKPGGSLY